jgi:hypothetical protein
VWRYILSSPSNKLHGPPAEVTACFPHDHLGWLPVGKKFDELVRELLLAERVVIDEGDELEVLVVGTLLFLRRRRACSTTSPATTAAAAIAAS